MSLSPSGRARMRVSAVALLICMWASHGVAAQCPTVIRVPQDASSINAAVAMVCASTAAEIVVGPGTWSAYVQPPTGSSIVIRGADRSSTTITPSGPSGKFTGISGEFAPERIRFVDARLQGAGGSNFEWRVSFTRCDVVGCSATFFPEGQPVTDTRFVDCIAGDGESLYLQRPTPVEQCQFIRCSRPINAWGASTTDRHLIRACQFVDCSGPVWVRALARLENCMFSATATVSGPAVAGIPSAPVAGVQALLEITNCTFSGIGSASIQSGGAVLINGSCGTTITGSTFTNCRAASGGAIYMEPASARHVRLIGCTFTGNSATSGSGGAVHQSAGGSGQLFTAADCTFIGNSAAADGGALNLRGSSGIAEITACSFRDNTASSGGGALCVSSGTVSTVSACALSGNRAVQQAAAILATGSSTRVTVSGCIASNNGPQSGTVPPALVARESATLSVASSTFCNSGTPPWSGVPGGTATDAGGNSTSTQCADCNNDGTWDVLQIRSGSLADRNGSAVPDCCEGGEPWSCVAGLNAVRWRLQDGGNGHWYSVRSTRLSWAAADAAARAIGGHLVSITTPAEHAFIKGLALPAGIDRGLWSGGLKVPPPPDEVGCDAIECWPWGWSTGEPWNHEAWGIGEPDRGGPTDYVEVLQGSAQRWGAEDGSTQLHWIVEWSADCNGDGIVDYGQCRDGSLLDTNLNNIPDCCELGVPCATGDYPVQWRTEDGGNGHWYWVRGQALPWHDAQSSALALGGHLASVTSSAENEFLKRLWQPPSSLQGAWAGGYKIPEDPDTSSCEAIGCDWAWVADGIDFTGFFDWGAGQPDGRGVGQDRLEILHTASLTWNDQFAWVALPWIMEWSADCNGDGIVDYGQIVRGELGDADGDGVPDACQCAGDVTRNGVVDGADLATLLSAWGSSGQGQFDTDIDNDGTVSGKDLAYVLSGWGPCP